MRRVRLLVGIALLFLWLGGVQQAGAHALLVRSVPEANAALAEPPESLELWFSEPLEASFSSVRLLDGNGQELATDRATVDPADPTHMTLTLNSLEPGNYTVAWQTFSQADGHEWQGFFPFVILNPDGSFPQDRVVAGNAEERGDLPAPLEIVARWLTLLGAMMLFGAPLFQRAVVLPIQRYDEAAGNVTRQLVLRLVWLASLAIIAGSWLQVGQQALQLGTVEQLPALLLETRTGALSLTRQLLTCTSFLVALTVSQPPPLRGRERSLFYGIGAFGITLLLLLVLGVDSAGGVVTATILAVAVTVVLAARALPIDSQAAHRQIMTLMLLPAAFLLLTLSLSSHAAAAPGSFWSVLGDYVHLLGGATWLGGLLLLALLLWQFRRRGIAPAPRQLLPLARRFSYLASFSVFILVLTGLFNSLIELPNLTSLYATPYGQVLLLKLALVTLALSVAFLNSRLLHRKALNDAELRWRQLGRQIALEAGVALVIMVSVAILVQTPPPRSSATISSAQANTSYSTVLEAEDLQIHVQVTPNQVGRNRFQLHLSHPDGSSIGDVQLVRLLFNDPEEQLGQASLDLTPSGQNTFAAEGAYLNRSGPWDISVYVRRRDLDDTLADFSLDVPSRGEPQTTASLWQNPLPRIPSGVLLGIAVLMLGMAPLLWLRAMREVSPDRSH